MRVRAYRDPSAGIVVIDSQTKQPLQRKGSCVVLRLCKVGYDNDLEAPYVEGALPESLYVLRGDRLAVRSKEQWVIFALTPALFSKDSRIFYRLPAGETDKRKAERLHVCSWAVLLPHDGLKVTQR